MCLGLLCFRNPPPLLINGREMPGILLFVERKVLGRFWAKKGPPLGGFRLRRPQRPWNVRLCYAFSACSSASGFCPAGRPSTVTLWVVLPSKVLARITSVMSKPMVSFRASFTAFSDPTM